MGYDRSLISAWDMSTINPVDVGWRNLGNDGVGVGLVAATDIVDGIAGGKATEYNGVNERTDIGTAVMEPAAEGSITGWFKAHVGHPVTGSIWAKGNLFAGLYFSGATTLHFSLYDGVNHIAAGGGWVDDTWHHTVCTWGSAGMILYRNGEPVGANAYTGTHIGAGSIFRFGESGGGTRYLEGVLDDIRIYDVALTRLQCADLHQRSLRGAT